MYPIWAFWFENKPSGNPEADLGETFALQETGVDFRQHKSRSKIWCLKATDLVVAFTILPVAVTITWRGQFRCEYFIIYLRFYNFACNVENNLQ
jgi:hypothetical protein